MTRAAAHPLSDIDRSRSNARKGLGLTDGSLIERRKLPVCATVAETTFPFHYVLIRGFRLHAAQRWPPMKERPEGKTHPRQSKCSSFNSGEAPQASSLCCPRSEVF